MRRRVLVVGGGIAGVSLGYELSRDHEVLVVESEPTLAAHSTGRSAALFVSGIGPEPIRHLSRASLPLFTELADELGTPAILRQRGGLHTAWTAEQGAAVQVFVANEPAVAAVSADEALALCPVLRREGLRGACWDPLAGDLDVMALHDGYVRGIRRAGGEVATDAGVLQLARTATGWGAQLGDDRSVQVDVVVNAAGAWGDRVNALAGLPTQWLTPCRRTAALAAFGGPSWTGPAVGGIDGSWYAKPEGDAVLVSPCDETPVSPGDARPEELDVALALERVNEATVLGLRSVRTAWAGLRTFADDHVPVVGWRDDDRTLFAYLGQGGYGIQAGPALARLGAHLVRGDLPPEQEQLAASVAPDRLQVRR